VRLRPRARLHREAGQRHHLGLLRRQHLLVRNGVGGQSAAVEPGSNVMKFLIFW
jgi:hypothetical protein